MRKNIGISALALSMALAATPAGAQLNLGGNGPLIDLGGGGEPTVDVNLGNTGVTVDLGGTPDVTVDLDTDTDGAVTVDIPTDGDDGIGGVLDLDSGDGDIGVDLNSGDDDDLVLGLPNEDEVYIDLFGKRTGKGQLGLGNAAVGDLVTLEDTNVEDIVDLNVVDDDALADLFGPGGIDTGLDVVDDVDALETLDANVLDDLDADVLNEGVDIGEVGDGLLGNTLSEGVDIGDISADQLLGGDSIITLFGEGGQVEVVDLNSLNDPDLLSGIMILPHNDVTEGEEDTTVVVYPPPPAEPVETETVVAGKDPRGNSTSGTTLTANRATARAAVAKADAKCFTPDDNQIAHLVQARRYSSQSVAAWRNADAVTLVPVRLCPEARVKVSEVTYADANMQMMRNGIAASPAIRQKLGGNGLDAGNVLAVDSKNGGLTVYVY